MIGKFAMHRDAPLSFRLDDRAALITGAARGIGAAIAQAFAALGARVAVNDIDALGCARMASEIGGIAVPGDVGDEAAVDRIFAATLGAFGGLDILVCNAGMARTETIFETTLASWNEIMRVNLTSVFLCSKRAMEIMRAGGQGGRIICTGSVNGHAGSFKGHVHYAASKAGLHGFVKTLARTGAPLAVTVNAIAPGLVATDLLLAAHGEVGMHEFAKQSPLGLATPADIAAAAVYLASGAGRHVTGAVIDVNGGIYMR